MPCLDSYPDGCPLSSAITIRPCTTAGWMGWKSKPEGRRCPTRVRTFSCPEQSTGYHRKIEALRPQAGSQLQSSCACPGPDFFLLSRRRTCRLSHSPHPEVATMIEAAVMACTPGLFAMSFGSLFFAFRAYASYSAQDVARHWCQASRALFDRVRNRLALGNPIAVGVGLSLKRCRLLGTMPWPRSGHRLQSENRRTGVDCVEYKPRRPA